MATNAAAADAATQVSVQPATPTLLTMQPVARSPTPRFNETALLPPKLCYSSSGAPYLPSYPLYCRYVLRAARTFLSPASASLLHYALYFHFRQQTTKALHFLHLLYVKCMYVRVREEDRRRTRLLHASPHSAHRAAATDGISDATSSPEERDLMRRLRSMNLPPHGHPHPDHCSGGHMSLDPHPLTPPSAAAASSTGALAPPATLHNAISSSPRSGHSPSGSWASRPSIIASLTAAGASALSFPFSQFASLFTVFTEATMVGYCSIEWQRQELFLRANAQPRCSEDAMVCEKKLGLHKEDPGSRPGATMMVYQTALASSLQPVSPAEHYAPRNDSQELEVLAILRTDADLNHYPIDWASLLMLTHESFARHLARLQRSQEHSNETLARTTEVTVTGRSSRALPADAAMAPGAFSEVPVVGTSPTQASASFSNVVMHALETWRAQKKEQRRLERQRRATTPSRSASTSTAAPASALAAATAAPVSPSADASSDDICYIPLTAHHRMERNLCEETAHSPSSGSGGGGGSGTAAASKKPLSAALRRWQFLRSELHKRRLLRTLHIQREFYLSLAKHKVLTHRSSSTKSASNGQQQHRRNVSSSLSSGGTPTFSFSGGGSAAAASSVMRSASVPNLPLLALESVSDGGGASGASTPLLSGTASPDPFGSTSSRHLALSPVAGSPPPERDGHGETLLPLTVSSPTVPPSPSPPPRRPVILFMAGGMSAGKSTVIAHLRSTGSLFDIADDAVLIEADKFKMVDPVYQSLPTSDPTRSLFVHSQSLITAEETLLAATRAGRDIIVDGTMSWLPYVSQTFDMIRHVHRRRYGRGPGFNVDARTGDVTEQYWLACGDEPVKRQQSSNERIEEAARLGESFTFSPSPPSATTTTTTTGGSGTSVTSSAWDDGNINGSDESDDHVRVLSPAALEQCETIPASESHLPYIICMLGVTADWPVAVTRAVPIDKMLNSYVLFSRNFDAYAGLVDAFMLFDNSADAEGGLAGEGAPRPTLVAARALGEKDARVVRPDLWAAFRQQAFLPTDATNATEMVEKMRRVHEEQVRARAQAPLLRAKEEGGVSPEVELDPLPPAPSLSQIYPPLSVVLPFRLRWLLAKTGGDDDVITEDDIDEEEVVLSPMVPEGAPHTSLKLTITQDG